MGGKLGTAPRRKQTAPNELDGTGFLDTRGFFKFKNSFPRKITPDNFDDDLMSLGYNLNNLPPRQVRHVKIENVYDRLLKPILDHKGLHCLHEDVDLGIWCADLDGEISEKVEISLKYFQRLYDEHIFKSKKKDKPIALKLMVDKRFNSVKLFAEYLENDDDYFSRLKYLVDLKANETSN